MYVGLKNIQRLFADHPTLLRNSDGMHCLTGWTKLSSAPIPYTAHQLYTYMYDEVFHRLPFTDDMHVLCIVPKGIDMQKVADETPARVSLLIMESDEPEAPYTTLQQYFNMQCGVGMFGQTLLEFLAFEDGLQPAIDHSWQVFHNPIFVFDTSYNLIAATWDAIEQLDIKDDVVVNKRFSTDDFKMASREHNLHNKVTKSEIPIRAYNEELGYEQMYCAINTRKNLGHIVVSAVNKPFEPIDTELMLILKKYVDQQLKKDSFIRNSKGFNYEYFLRDLLDGKVVSGSAGKSNMQYTGSEFSGNMYCLVVETARSASTINTHHIRNVVESRFPNSKTMVYNGQIIAIISIPNKQLLPDEYRDAAVKICKDDGLYAGLSNCFIDIMDFREYYHQALRALELGTSEDNEPNLFCYSDYYLDHMTNIFLQKESAKTFCHPKMKFLLDYDKAHKSELAYTLYMYLVYERNLAAASEAMQMHRTSLVYRFKKINSLIGDDFEDYKERLYMILSYEMNK